MTLADVSFFIRSVTEWVQSLRRYDLRSEDVPSALLHEATRIFSDRLVGPEPRADFERILTETFKATWWGGAEKAEYVYSVVGGCGRCAAVGSRRISGECALSIRDTDTGLYRQCAFFSCKLSAFFSCKLSGFGSWVLLESFYHEKKKSPALVRVCFLQSVLQR